jgi:hypothetical protein
VTLIASQLKPEEQYLQIKDGLTVNPVPSRTAKTARHLNPDGSNMRKYFARQRKD